MSLVLGWAFTQKTSLLKLWVGFVWGGRWVRLRDTALSQILNHSRASLPLGLVHPDSPGGWVQPTHLSACISHRTLLNQWFPEAYVEEYGWMLRLVSLKYLIPHTVSFPFGKLPCSCVSEEPSWFLLTFGVDNTVQLPVLGFPCNPTPVDCSA